MKRDDLRKVMCDILTGPDGRTFDLIRVQTFFGGLLASGLETYVVLVRDAPFDMIQFGTALGLIVACGAGGMRARRDVEQGPQPKP